MRAGGTILVTTVLLSLLAAVGWFAYAGLPGPGEPRPPDYYVALVMGGLAAVLVGMRLMGLGFL
jgi:ABC-type transporter Mla subunit MlaD